jgi:hypothetical protein
MELFEYGGLKPEHWTAVRQAASRSSDKSDIVIRIDRYATAVLHGEVPSAGNVHREYLGRRHWNEIQSLLPDDLWLVAAKAFAAREAEQFFSFDDYFDRLAPLVSTDRVFFASTVGSNMRWAGWSWRLYHTWETETVQENPYPSACSPEDMNVAYLDPDSYSEDVVTWETRTEDVTDRYRDSLAADLYSIWLLTPDEVANPLRTSPADLVALARTVPEPHLAARLALPMDPGYGVRRGDLLHARLTGWERDV